MVRFSDLGERTNRSGFLTRERRRDGAESAKPMAGRGRIRIGREEIMAARGTNLRRRIPVTPANAIYLAVLWRTRPASHRAVDQDGHSAMRVWFAGDHPVAGPVDEASCAACDSVWHSGFGRGVERELGRRSGADVAAPIWLKDY